MKPLTNTNEFSEFQPYPFREKNAFVWHGKMEFNYMLDHVTVSNLICLVVVPNAILIAMRTHGPSPLITHTMLGSEEGVATRPAQSRVTIITEL